MYVVLSSSMLNSYQLYSYTMYCTPTLLISSHSAQYQLQIFSFLPKFLQCCLPSETRLSTKKLAKCRAELGRKEGSCTVRGRRRLTVCPFLLPPFFPVMRHLLRVCVASVQYCSCCRPLTTYTHSRTFVFVCVRHTLFQNRCELQF